MNDIKIVKILKNDEKIRKTETMNAFADNDNADMENIPIATSNNDLVQNTIPKTAFAGDNDENNDIDMDPYISDNNSISYSYTDDNIDNINNNNNKYSFTSVLTESPLNSSNSVGVIDNNNLYSLNNIINNKQLVSDDISEMMYGDKALQKVLELSRKEAELMANILEYRQRIGTAFNSKTLTAAQQGYGIMALHNLTNTCYFNSVIHPLLHCHPFHQYFINKTYLSEINTQNILSNKGVVVKAWDKLFQKAFVEKKAVVSPWEFINVVTSLKPQFQNYLPHDVAELLFELLDLFHQDVNIINSPENVTHIFGKTYFDQMDCLQSLQNWNARDNSFVMKTFYSFQSTSQVCQQCDIVSTKYEILGLLNLPIPMPQLPPQKVTFEECLNNYYNKTEELTANNVYACNACLKREKCDVLLKGWCRQSVGNNLYHYYVERIDEFKYDIIAICYSYYFIRYGLKKIKLLSAPEVFIVAFTRFIGNNNYKKDTHISYPINGFDIGPYICSTYNIQTKYDLFAVVCHHGQRIDGFAHYTSLVKNLFTNVWYKMDDAQKPQRIHQQSVVLKDAYILFYKKRIIGNNKKNHFGFPYLSKRISHLLSQDPDTIVSKINNFDVTVHDLNRISPWSDGQLNWLNDTDKWLNDTDINAFLFLLSRKYPNCYFARTQFYTRLAYNGVDNNEYKYKNVRRWTRKSKFEQRKIYDKKTIFEFDKLIIPINTVEKNHWLLSVIGIRVNWFKVDIFDTMYSHEKIQNYQDIYFNLQQYILDEREHKIGDDNTFNPVWSFDFNANYPSQIGGIDCGVHTAIGAGICASGQSPINIIDTSENGALQGRFKILSALIYNDKICT
eukprot:167650_1